MEAETRRAVVDRLHALGHVPLRVEEVGATLLGKMLSADLFSHSISTRTLALLTAQLGILLRAGLDIDAAMTVLQDLVQNDRAKDVLRRVVERLRGGASLADSMAPEKEVFAGYYVSMVRAGESGASLDATLERLADFLARAQATRDHIKSAMIYPAIVALTCCLSIATMFLFVVPRFRPLSSRAVAPCPARPACCSGHRICCTHTGPPC